MVRPAGQDGQYAGIFAKVLQGGVSTPGTYHQGRNEKTPYCHLVLIAVAGVKRPSLRIRFRIAVRGCVRARFAHVCSADASPALGRPGFTRSASTPNELFADSVGWEDVAHEVESNIRQSPRLGANWNDPHLGPLWCFRAPQIYGDITRASPMRAERVRYC
jgi:hypothetical protein